jgi:putative transposase
MTKKFHTHPIHLPPVHRHNTPIILHVTISLANKAAVLNDDQAHQAMIQAWFEAAHWRVGEYTIMPDHVHFFCSPGLFEYPSIRRWAGFWKRKVGVLHPILRGVFLEDCWDTQMRDLAHYEEKLSYVRLNPVRKGLVENWEDWPFRGKVFDVDWV